MTCAVTDQPQCAAHLLEQQLLPDVVEQRQRGCKAEANEEDLAPRPAAWATPVREAAQVSKPSCVAVDSEENNIHLRDVAMPNISKAKES